MKDRSGTNGGPQVVRVLVCPGRRYGDDILTEALFRQGTIEFGEKAEAFHFLAKSK